MLLTAHKMSWLVWIVWLSGAPNCNTSDQAAGLRFLVVSTDSFTSLCILRAGQIDSSSAYVMALFSAVCRKVKTICVPLIAPFIIASSLQNLNADLSNIAGAAALSEYTTNDLSLVKEVVWGFITAKPNGYDIQEIRRLQPFYPYLSNKEVRRVPVPDGWNLIAFRKLVKYAKMEAGTHSGRTTPLISGRVSSAGHAHANRYAPATTPPSPTPLPRQIRVVQNQEHSGDHNAARNDRPLRLLDLQRVVPDAPPLISKAYIHSSDMSKMTTSGFTYRLSLF